MLFIGKERPRLRFSNWQAKCRVLDQTKRIRKTTVIAENAPYRRIWRGADGLFRYIENAAAIVAGLMMLIAMFMTTADALLRYTLNSPISFNFFVTENYLLVGLICMPMAWAFRTGGYIRVSFLLHVLPEKMGNIMMRVGFLASAVFCSELAWLGGENWFEIWQKKSVEMDVVDFPWHWSWIWVPIGVGLLSLRLFLLTFGPADDLNKAHSDTESAA
jgi:TRAP-type C4-dicarboxylate transport system permease small subunit